MSLPPRNSAHLRLRRDEPSHRDEGRQLMHAVLDGEIDEQSPRLQELLNLDPVLRAEFDELRAMQVAFASPLTTPDVAESVLARLQTQRDLQNRRISPFFGGLAASVAIGSLVAWALIGRTQSSEFRPTSTLATALTPSVAVGAPTVSNEERIVEEARRTIAETTGRPLSADAQRRFAPSPGLLATEPSTQGPKVAGDQSPARSMFSSGGDVSITRAGLALVNVGPARMPVAKLANDPMLGRPVAGSDWQPTATRRRDNVRFVVSGWYDSDGNSVPVANTKR